ncbi:hypothetical protein VP01_1645g1 [Puccinia sorghi]|uniref:Reverse transcriptase Ty1/copia-type domain-containing protein n=1 Tax=Puccinia sorghi TaxID=27349 RepID=A0A0L6VGN1_9BASI|nr:hypothetical protein VP01_1645g1 [Puccinia sorghi]
MSSAAATAETRSHPLAYISSTPLVQKNDTTNTLINLLESEKTRCGYLPSMICSDGGGEFVGNRATHCASNIPKRFWHKILKLCFLALNQIPKRGMNRSPWEILHGQKFPDKLLKSLGTPTIILKQTRTKGRKFDKKGEEGKLIGFNTSLLSYQVLTQFGRIMETKHVRFLKKTNESPKLDLDVEEEFKFPSEEQQDKSPPMRYGFHNCFEPNTFESAILCEDAKHWKRAIEKEVNSIESHDVWEDYEEEPLNPLNTMWVFRIKDNTHGDPLKFKGRLCVQGFNEIYGTDYEETYALTGRVPTL